MKLPVYSLFILQCNALIFSLVRVAFYLTLIGVNRPNLHDGVILLLQLELFSFFLSYLNLIISVRFRLQKR